MLYLCISWLCPVHSGKENEYRKIGSILAKCMDTAFSIKNSSDVVESGEVGDYLGQSTKGVQWVIKGEDFNRLYCKSSKDENAVRETEKPPAIVGSKTLV